MSKNISPQLKQRISDLDGPIMVTGAGGFIGINMLTTLLSVRDDVYGVSENPLNNWRFIAAGIPVKNLLQCDITDTHQVRKLISTCQPKGVFNFAAYGAYSKQDEYEKIYRTNFIASVDLIEALRKNDFSFFIQAGSSSEYGYNSAAPAEDGELLPNSHYAVSKAAIWHAVQNFGKTYKLPVAHLRIYSAYGPWEEPDRLVPVLLAALRKKTWPPLVSPLISRDFIHVDDVVEAFIHIAAGMNTTIAGNAFNVGTGVKTTIEELCKIVTELFQIETPPVFSSMPDRGWDLINWYARPDKIKSMLNWHSRISLKDGLKQASDWQREADFDHAFWNWTIKL